LSQTVEISFCASVAEQGVKKKAAKTMINPRLSRVWFLLSVCFVLSTGSAPADAENPPPTSDTPTHISYTFPFTTLAYGAPVVQAKVNDTVMGTFLIDTGSGANLLTQTMVDKLGLKPRKISSDKAPYILDGKPATMISPLKLQIGPLATDGGAYLVITAKTMAAATGSATVDGIISMQALRYFAMDIDFLRHQMTLWYPNGLKEDAVKQAGFSEAITVPLIPSIPDSILYDPVKAVASQEAYWNLVFRVSVQLSDGVHVSQQNLVLDTGSGSTNFPSSVAASLKLKTYETVKNPNTLDGANSTDVALAPSVQLGSLCLRDHPIGIYQASMTPGTPNLGLDMLYGYRVLIDFGAKKMYLKPNFSVTVTPAMPKSALTPNLIKK
jgi:hypothetical protein